MASSENPQSPLGVIMLLRARAHTYTRNMINEIMQQAAVFEESGQLDLAQNIYNVALQLLPESASDAKARILIRRGRLNYRLNNHQGAMDDLQQAFSLDPTVAEALSGEFSKFYKEGCHGK